MTLDENVKRELNRDYNVVSALISNVLHDKKNKIVSDSDYLRPTIVLESNQEVPLDSKEGEFYYFNIIRTAIEFALFTGTIPKSIGDELKPQFPKYLLDLIEE